MKTPPMPTLHWIGKDKVVNHHHEVPFRVLERDAAKSFVAPDGSPSNSSENRIIHGDNLEALKSLLPEFEGRVKCIYIDPPYNTGEEGWVYNDNVNDPKLKKWLGEVVGKEGEDLSRHDKWLCMMYPRLKLLHRLLADEGSIWVSIDDNEMTSLKLIMDEIFGTNKYIASNVWQKRYSRENREAIGDAHEYIITYAKNPDKFKATRNKVTLTESQAKVYKNPNNDPRGRWRTIPLTAQDGHATKDQFYEIKSPGGKIHKPPSGRCWGLAQSTFEKLKSEGKIYFGKSGNSQPNLIRYLSEVEGIVPWTWWPHDEVGHTDESKKEMHQFFGKIDVFGTPKPVRLMERILQIATNSGDLVLDSFAGSGTTAHAALKMNRRFILIETMDYADNITAERVRRVIKGYGEDKKAVPGTGGGFDYYEMGPPIFKEPDLLNEEVGVEVIRSYVAHSEGIPKEQRCGQDNPVCPYLLGFNEDIAWLFYYEKDRMTTLDLDFLRTLKFDSPRPASALIYADRCILPKEFLAQHRLIFKKIPRDIARF